MLSFLTSLPDTDDDKAKKITELYNDTVKPLYSYLTRSMELSREDAEDLMQEAYIYVYRRFDSLELDDSRNALSYLICVCRSRYRNALRSKDPLVAELVDGLDDAEGKADPGDLEGEFADAEAVRSAMAALPDRYRRLLTMIYYHDMTYAEISELTGVDPGTLRKSHYTALRKLRSLIETEDLK